MKRKPKGFVAVCQCGVNVGAMDYERTERKEAGKMLGGWLADGCIVIPKFQSTWGAAIESCRCNLSSSDAEGRR